MGENWGDLLGELTGGVLIGHCFFLQSFALITARMLVFLVSLLSVFFLLIVFFFASCCAFVAAIWRPVLSIRFTSPSLSFFFLSKYFWDGFPFSRIIPSSSSSSSSTPDTLPVRFKDLFLYVNYRGSSVRILLFFRFTFSFNFIHFFFGFSFLSFFLWARGEVSRRLQCIAPWEGRRRWGTYSSLLYLFFHRFFLDR